MVLFVDQARVQVKSGKGGKGCHSFYRDKYTRYGIPDGGYGGKGGDIIIQADKNLYTLLDFKYNLHFFAADGGHGSGKKKKGKDAPALIIKVPVGTLVRDAATNCVLRDLSQDGVSLLAARGGKGGLGNQHDHDASEGFPGEERELLFDLKLIADVGLVGFPNVGKSTLISAISSAHPKIAPYPFTTKSPVLGVVRYKELSFVVADIPGLIAGSHEGKGLGDRFLRHIERSKIIVHLVDISGYEGRIPWEDFRQINQELEFYSGGIVKKNQIIAANKMDLEGAQQNLKYFRKRIKKKVYPISALKKEGLEDLIKAIIHKIKNLSPQANTC